MKKVLGRYGNNSRHWVGDGFPVRSLVSYNTLGQHISPFLLLDYAGPHMFDPADAPRGVERHPHRGFETVTIVYDGEVEHRDSTGHGGVIGPGDVQWMTAASGILHEEMHSKGFTRAGGPFRMVQLWVNLPAKDKSASPGYQSLLKDDIPEVELADGAGRVPARTFTPINVWDVRLKRDASVTFDLPEGHTVLLAVLGGHVTVNGAQQAGEAEVILLAREGREVMIDADGDTTLLVLTGEPIDEPIVGYGPFVMNSQAEIRQAIEDFNRGRFGDIAAA